MLHLNAQSLSDKFDWDAMNIKLPEFDIQVMVEKTKKHPSWLHFGSGNIFRGFIAALQQKLLNLSAAETGIIAVGGYDYEIIDQIYRPYDNLTLLVQLFPDGSMDKQVIASVAESLTADISKTEDWERLKQIFCEPTLQMVSFTITEKGYALTNLSGSWLQDVQMDLVNGPGSPTHLMSKITNLAYIRYLSSEMPIAFVSMDNCSHNGELLHDALITIAREWNKSGFVDDRFINYLNDKNTVAFPWTMIDKITPHPSERVKNELKQLNLADMEIISTSKNSHAAPFVNAEVPEYLVIEDHFPNGRMPLEKAGVLFADRDSVEKAEKMKVTTCLNPLHTALAVFGCILKYHSIADSIKDDDLSKLVKKIGYDEGIPVVVNSGLLDPMDFITEVIEKRLPNPYIPDSPQRIATDTSQKMAIRYGETIKSYLAHVDLDVKRLRYIPLVIAGWCRYLLGVDDKGINMPLSSDPMLEPLTESLKDIKLGDMESYHGQLIPILSNEKLFGLNLYEAGLGDLIESYFLEFISGIDAVRNTLHSYVNLT